MSAPNPKKCHGCGVVPVAWTTPRVDYCYRCLPGGPFAAPPCTRCGSGRYFSNGLCDGCHGRGPRHVGSCEGCLAWGVYRTYRWRCWNCKWWHSHYVEGDCRFCGRHTTISELRACRLCWEQARLHQQPGRAVDLADATRFGQQLFFANFAGNRAKPHHHLEPPARPRRPRSDGKRPALRRLSKVDAGQQFTPVPWLQLRLVDVEPDVAVLAARAAETDDDEMLRYCDAVVVAHAGVHGWSRKQTNDVRRTIRFVVAMSDTPGGRVNASDVLKVPALHANVSAVSTIDVLAAAGLLVDDRPSAVERFFTAQFVGLPVTMTAQLRIWFEVMINGSTTAPRRKPRDPKTAQLHIRGLAPILRIWASQGHDSLASIERDHIVAVLPDPGPRRHAADQGLRSLFEILKARKVVFINPTRGVAPTNTNTNIPLPLDAGAIRAALDSPDAAAALAVALVTFHALTARQIRELLLTDIVDGRLHLEDRAVPLAAPVLPRLTAWLDYRARRWPATANPHLFVNFKTAPRLSEVSRSFPWKQVNLAPQTLREDRILDEIRATGGDVRRVCDLFGLSVDGALRYTAALDPT